MTFSQYTTQAVDEILFGLNTSRATGLSSDEARTRRGQYGANEIVRRETTLRDLLIRQFRSSFIYLLLAAAFISFLLGEIIDGLLIVLFVLINVSLGFFQEYRSHKTIALLKQYMLPHATVLRDGAQGSVARSTVVPGDIIVVQPGAMVPADVRWIDANDLAIDESALTGESAPALKGSFHLAHAAQEIFQAINIGFAGTTVVRGRGTGVVIAIGARSAFGSVAALATETERSGSLEQGLTSFSSFILRLVLLTLAVLFLINIALKGDSLSWARLLVFSIALAVSVIPEALPLVMTFSLSHGARRLAQKKVVVKRLAAIENLGSIDVLCTDKTGTLTENVLTVAHILPRKKSDPLFWACAGTPHIADHVQRDPFDIAFWNALAPNQRNDVMRFERSAEIPFDPVRRRNTTAVRNGRSLIVISRGAYEHIVPLCAAIPKKERETQEQWIADEGRDGRRVVAISIRTVQKKDGADLKKDETRMRFAGLISLADPLKRSSKDAVFKARELGVQLKMLTGDSPEVAGAVARAIGLAESEHDVMTGSSFDHLTIDEQRQAVERINVFARVNPEQKFRIIQLLQHTHTVGFLGEGINDAPALKLAHVALVVQGGADIAREAADIVLLKKNLGVIVDGIQEGREVFVNTLKYIRATLASNFGNFYAVAVSSLFIPFLPMLPLQILLVNLLSDFPMIAIATDRVDRQDVKKPRTYHIRDIALITTLLGLVSTIFDFIFFALFRGFDPGILQTNWFMGSILTELAFLFSIRTNRFFLKAQAPSLSLAGFSALAIAATIVLPYTSIGQRLFLFIPPSSTHLIIIFTLVGAYLAVSEAVKLMYYRHVAHS
ncbi:HAD-IC family P-type ATPase [Candidatus Uhrbacteria bacterium]|nr:HAD-IC family P-type ATPase [Candidatus Uhrbacteria bacterium]